MVSYSNHAAELHRYIFACCVAKCHAAVICGHESQGFICPACADAALPVAYQHSEQLPHQPSSSHHDLSAGSSLPALHQPGLLQQHQGGNLCSHTQSQPAALQHSFQPPTQPQFHPSVSCHHQSSPIRHQDKSCLEVQSSSTARQTSAVGLYSQQTSQEQLIGPSQSGRALPYESPSKLLLAGPARSPLKGSNAWPPPSPSPKKRCPSPKQPGPSSRKPARSQNRQPARGVSASHSVAVQRHADVLELHQRLRSATTHAC